MPCIYVVSRGGHFQHNLTFHRIHLKLLLKHDDKTENVGFVYHTRLSITALHCTELLFMMIRNQRIVINFGKGCVV